MTVRVGVQIQPQHADRYVEQGITHLISAVSGPDYDLTSTRCLIAWRDRYRQEHAG